MKCSVLFSRFPGNHIDGPEATDWLVQTYCKARGDERIHRVGMTRETDTPITMTRNKVVQRAREEKFDLLVMLDNDMGPDYLLGQDPTAKPFWETAFERWWSEKTPMILGAPYCGPPPEEVPYAFQVATAQSGHPNKDFRFALLSREEAARRGGIEKVPCLPTGLVLIDMRVFDALKPPYFDYEWTDQFRTQKASTEDVYMTRNAALLGIPNYCLWDCWAIHYKRKAVGKPALITIDEIHEDYREAIARNHKYNEKLVMVGDDQKKDYSRVRGVVRANGQVDDISTVMEQLA